MAYLNQICTVWIPLPLNMSNFYKKKNETPSSRWHETTNLNGVSSYWMQHQK